MPESWVSVICQICPTWFGPFLRTLLVIKNASKAQPQTSLLDILKQCFYVLVGTASECSWMSWFMNADGNCCPELVKRLSCALRPTALFSTSHCSQERDALYQPLQVWTGAMHQACLSLKIRQNLFETALRPEEISWNHWTHLNTSRAIAVGRARL